MGWKTGAQQDFRSAQSTKQQPPTLYFLAKVKPSRPATPWSISFREQANASHSVLLPFAVFGVYQKCKAVFLVELHRCCLQSLCTWQKVQQREPSKGTWHQVAKVIFLEKEKLLFTQISTLLHSFYLGSVQPKLMESSFIQAYHHLFAGILANNSNRLTRLFLLWIFCIKLDTVH